MPADVMNGGCASETKQEKNKLTPEVWERKYTINTDEVSLPKKRAKAPRPPKVLQGLVLVAGTTLLFLVQGIGYSLSIIYVEVIAAFDTDRRKAALSQSLYVGIMFGAGVLSAGIIRRVGPGPCVMVGSLVMAGGFIAAAYCPNLIGFIACVGLLSGFGSSVLFASSFIAITFMFRGKKDIALICVSYGTALGEMILSFLTEACVNGYGWRGALLIIGGITLNGVTCGAIMYTTRPYFVKADTHTADEKLQLCNCSVLRDWVFVVLILSVYLAKSAGVEPWMIVDFSMNNGYSRQQGAMLVTLMGAGNIFGRSLGLALRFFVKLPSLIHWIYMELIMAISHLTLAWFHSYLGEILSSILFIIPFGTTMSLCPVLILEAVGLDRFPYASGLLNLALGVGTFTGDFMGGVVRDETGSYYLLLYLCAGACCLISGVLLFLYVFLKYTRNVYGPYVRVY